jgi:tetratricopeptide (TPR) repeat protein
VDASSQQVHLRRPDLAGIRGLLAERLRTGTVSDSVAAFVLERSGANPRYALGIVDALRSSGALHASGETWTLDPERAGAELPATLLPFLLATLELVPTPTRALLREAALYGVRFEPTLIAARLGLLADDVEAGLHELALSTDVVTRTASGFEFVEPLFAAYLEQLTPPAERTVLHRLHADLLQRRQPTDEAALGRHLLLAGDARAALPYLARAAQGALADHDPAQAKRLLELASRAVGNAADEAEAARDVEILLAYAKLLDQAGASEIAIRHLENAVLLAQAWGLGVLEVRATRALGRVEYQRGHYDAAVEHEQQELALQLGNIHFERGQSDAALAAYGGALVYAAEHGDADLEARASNNVALIESTLGHKDSAVRMFSRSLELFRGLGRDDAVARTYHNIGMTYLELHNPTEARVYFHKCMQLAEQVGLHEMLAVSCLEYSEASLQLGLTDEAGRTLQHALALCRERNDPLGVATAFRLLGSIAAAGGNHEAADTRLQQCIETLQPLGPTPHLALALKERGRMLLEAGRAGSAEEALYEARDVLGAVDAHDIGAEVEELLQRCRTTSIRP